MEIYGTNLSATTRLWAGADFSGTQAPTSLDLVKVTIGGQAAFLDYISPTQVNAQVPSGTPTGAQQMTVSTPAGISSAYNITVNALQPGLLAPSSFLIGGKQYVVAQFPDGTYVLPPNAIAGIPSRQAKPGETIVIYGIGFGPVLDSGNQNIPAGTIVTAANKLSNSVLDGFRRLLRNPLVLRPCAELRRALPIQRRGPQRGQQRPGSVELQVERRERRANALHRRA